jgi:hypothetical protein
MSAEPYSEIRMMSQEFTAGIPLEKEIHLDSNVVFQFDNTVENDIESDSVIASLFIPQEDFPNFNPEIENIQDITELENIDVNVSSALINGGFSVNYIEFNEDMSNEHYWVFTYKLHI